MQLEFIIQRIVHPINKKPDLTELKKLATRNFKDAKVTDNGNTLTIQFIGDGLNNENYFIELGLASIKSFLGQSYRNDEFKKYTFVKSEVMAFFSGQDRKPNQQVRMSLTFPQTELQKVNNFNNIDN